MAKKKSKKAHIPPPKDVVYLIGAGATQSEISARDAAPVNLLMRKSAAGVGLSERILAKASGASALGIRDEADIEKLISLLSSTGVHDLTQLAEELRRHYFREIVVGLSKAKVIKKPLLATALLELHANGVFSSKIERLRAVMSTNHDGLFQIAFSRAYGAVNLGVPFGSTDFNSNSPSGNPVPLLLQLHGSFTWSFALPMNVNSLAPNSNYSTDTIWIPPTIAKDSKSYPFNKLSGLASEILASQCDVLRVIGASMTQNDWNILSMIFTAQRQRRHQKGSAFRIELVMPHERGLELQKECSFLANLVPIGNLTEGNFAMYDVLRPRLTDEQRNPFLYWLKEKIRFHRRLGHVDVKGAGNSIKELFGER